MSTKSGFTLVELLVAVVLALVVVGATVSIFSTTSQILTTSEHRIAIFQNARAALQTISEDVANATTSEDFVMEVQNPSDNSSPQLLMKFATITSWLDSSKNISFRGKAKAYYYLQTKNNKWRLKRHLFRDNIDTDPTTSDLGDETFTGTLSDDIVCEFIAQDAAAGGIPEISLDYFFYEDPDLSDTDDTKVLRISSPTGNVEFDESTEALQLPIAIRLHINITDEDQRAVRTVTRTFWLTNAK